MPEPEAYEVFAVKYAERERVRPEHFLGGDPHDVPDADGLLRVGDRRSRLDDRSSTPVSTPSTPLRRNRRLLRTAAEGLGLIGIDASTAPTVVLTHLHYDHVGGFDQFPNARFHLQDREMAFATGRHMIDSQQSHAFTAEHVAEMVMAVHAKRVVFHDGDGELAPGLSRAPHRRPHRWSAGRAGQHRRGLAGAGLGRQPLLREHGGDAAVPDRVRRSAR